MRHATHSNDNRLDVSDERVGSLLGRSEQAEVVDRVEGEESSHGGLVDGRVGGQHGSLQ
jgi:hypothetical protein